ncbi:MAG: alpha/beta fold hydrolase [Acidobacteriota bacterium]
MTRRYRNLLIAFTAITLLLFGFTAASASALLDMLHRPRTVIADLPGSEVVQIQSQDHLKLKAAWLSAPQPSGRCVLFLHGSGGWRGRSQRLTPWLLSAGYSVLAPDMRAHGESEGETITYGLLEQYDAIAWASWLRARGCVKVFGIGESLGASVLIMAAGLHPETSIFEAIAAECPFADLLESAEQYGLSQFPVPESLGAPFAKLAVATGSAYVRFSEGLDFTEVLPVRSIAAVRVPVLLIHGQADTRTSPSHSLELARANPSHTELWLVPGARHVAAFTVAPAEYQRRVLALFAGK